MISTNELISDNFSLIYYKKSFYKYLFNIEVCFKYISLYFLYNNYNEYEVILFRLGSW